MDRRTLIVGAAAGAATVAATPAVMAQSASFPEISWRLISSFPKSLDTVFGASEAMARRVGAATGGKFKIQVFAAGEVVGGLQVFDAVANGTVQAGHTIASYYSGKDPCFAFSTGLPFGLNARQQSAWMSAGGLDLMRQFYAQHGITTFACGNTGTQMGGWFRRELKSVADLSGLKFRIGGLIGQVMTRLGVVPQLIAGGDIYPSLERGTIDAAEWVGPYDDEKLGFVKVAPYYYAPGFWEGGPQVDLFVNSKEWEKLPPEYKAAFEAACAEAGAGMLARYDAQNPAALTRLVGAGAQVRLFPNDIMVAAFKESEALMEEIGQKNTTFKDLLGHYRTFRKDQYRWFSVAETRYDSFMISALR